MERCGVMGMGRKYELVGVAVGRAVWKEFLKGREFDTVTSTRSRYHANEIWRTADGRYFITSHGKGVTTRIGQHTVGLNVYTRVWLSEEDIKKLEEEGRLLKKWDYKVYDGDKIVSEGRTLTEDFGDLTEIIIRRLRKEGFINYKDYYIRIERAYLKGDYDRTMRIEIDFALKIALDLVYFPSRGGYDLDEVWTETAHAKGMYYRKGMQEWGELKIGDYVVKFERSFNP